MKKTSKKCFADVEELKQKMAETLKVIKISEFRNCFEHWKKRLDRGIASDAPLKVTEV